MESILSNLNFNQKRYLQDRSANSSAASKKKEETAPKIVGQVFKARNLVRPKRGQKLQVEAPMSLKKPPEESKSLPATTVKSTQKVQPPPVSEKKGNENNEEEKTAQVAVQKPQSFLNKVLKLKKA